MIKKNTFWVYNRGLLKHWGKHVENNYFWGWCTLICIQWLKWDVTVIERVLMGITVLLVKPCALSIQVFHFLFLHPFTDKFSLKRVDDWTEKVWSLRSCEDDRVVNTGPENQHQSTQKESFDLTATSHGCHFYSCRCLSVPGPHNGGVCDWTVIVYSLNRDIELNVKESNCVYPEIWKKFNEWCFSSASGKHKVYK